MKICLNICYQGSDFHGWQTQPTVVTVQETLEAALARVADDPVKVICAGRTDSGVHGLGQIVHLECAKTRTMEAWVRGTNRYLPDSIKVLWALPVDDDFHARFSAKARASSAITRRRAVESERSIRVTSQSISAGATAS